MSYLALYIDTFSGKALIKPIGTDVAVLPDIYSKDNLPLDVFFCTPTGDSRWPYKIERYQSATVLAKIAAAVAGSPAASGTFTVTHSGNTTAAQAYNVSTATLDSALEGLASITSAVTITGVAGLYYVVEFNGGHAATAMALMSAASSLLDASGVPMAVNVARLQGGTASRNEIQIVYFTTAPGAQNTLSTEIVPAGVTATVTQAQSGDGSSLHEVQRITFADKPATGYYTLNFGTLGTTGQIPVTAADLDIATAINAVLGAGKVDVTTKPLQGVASWQIEIRFSDVVDYAACTIDITNLQFFYGWRGVLAVASSGIFIGTAVASIATTFEIDLTPSGGAIQTVLQKAVTLFRAAGA